MQANSYSTAGQALGIGSLILGILALLFSFIPCFGYFALAPAALAILLGALGLVKASNENAPKGIILAGLIIGIIAFLIAGAWGLFLKSGNDAMEELDQQIRQEMQNVYIEDEHLEGIDETVSDINKTIDSIDVNEVNITINNKELTSEEKEKLKESIKDASEQIGNAFKEVAKDLEEIEDNKNK